MREIHNADDLESFLNTRHAVLFFHAPWSEYAVLSKSIVEFIEKFRNMNETDLKFFFGIFEDNKLDLAHILANTGISSYDVAAGNGCLACFLDGKLFHTFKSVVGEGSWKVHEILDDFEKA